VLQRPLHIRLETPWPQTRELGDGTVISSDITAERSDAGLFYWQAPANPKALLRPYLWYNCEPAWSFPTIENGAFARTLREIPTDAFANHSHPNLAIRTPHVTHWGIPTVSPVEMARKNEAIAIVSNCGFGEADEREGIRLRNTMVTAKHVALFGNAASWGRFRRPFPGMRSRPPANYRGQIPSDDGRWHSDTKRTLMTQYHACVCLENSTEPYYFTEKFLEAVVAGCVPVYHAHHTVRNTFLDGAFWIDPADHHFDRTKTIDAALSCDRAEVAAQNTEWLRLNKSVAATSGEAVFERLATILGRRVDGVGM